MAQEKEVKEKPKRTRKTQKSAKEKPYVEQINELLFVHNKEDPKAGVQAVSEIDGEGKVRTVPAEEKNENSFLKFEKNSSILENFIRNFWSQLKDPTRFGILTIKEETLDNPEVRQAVEDIVAGKQTKAVEESDQEKTRNRVRTKKKQKQWQRNKNQTRRNRYHNRQFQQDNRRNSRHHATVMTRTW